MIWAGTSVDDVPIINGSPMISSITSLGESEKMLFPSIHMDDLIPSAPNLNVMLSMSSLITPDSLENRFDILNREFLVVSER